MRFFLLIACFLFFGLNFVSAQKFGYFDSEFVLSKMPEYSKAQGEIDQLSSAWQKEIEDMQKKVDELYRIYQAEQVLLTEEMKQERLDEIKKKETELKDYQKKVFGFGGLFFLKKQELIKPLQDKVFDAVQKIAQMRTYDFIFDKASGGAAMLYTNPQYDVSEEVLKKLGM